MTTIEEEILKTGIDVDESVELQIPCCIDFCNNLPTFECKVIYEDILIGSVFICKGCLAGTYKLPYYAIRNSSILRRLLKIV